MKCHRVTKCMYGGLCGIRHVLNRQTPNCVPFIQFVFSKKHMEYHAIPCPMVTKCPMCNRQTHLSLFSVIPIHPKSHWKQAGDSRLILNKRTKKTEAGDPSPPSRLRLLFFIHSTTYLEFLLLQLLEILETLDSCKKIHSY